jgi:hypothetical protein
VRVQGCTLPFYLFYCSHRHPSCAQQPSTGPFTEPKYQFHPPPPLLGHYKTPLYFILPSTPTCSSCLTMRAARPLTTQRLDTRSSLSVAVRLRHLQYFNHTVHYQPTITNTYVTGSRYSTNALPSISPARNYRYDLLRQFPATNTFLIPSSFPTTYP